MAMGTGVGGGLRRREACNMRHFMEALSFVL